jgi:hypothetical protein
MDVPIKEQMYIVTDLVTNAKKLSNVTVMISKRGMVQHVDQKHFKNKR